ncbi:MAG TPA: TraR/DksA C4-type zinc finger protein [Chloroflexota bacterium]|nr:TraR/DksA C4-type zinc finger protein [Chloroflexota bacterium]
MAHQTAFYDSTRAMLERERTVIMARMQSLEQNSIEFELDSDGVPPSGLEREGAIGAMLQSRLADIDNAIARLDDGTYGVCTTCAEPIPPRRLEALPFATLCVPCQSQAEKRVGRRVAVR